MIGKCSKKGMGIWIRKVAGEQGIRQEKLLELSSAKSGTSFMSTKGYESMKKSRE